MTHAPSHACARARTQKGGAASGHFAKASFGTAHRIRRVRGRSLAAYGPLGTNVSAVSALRADLGIDDILFTVPDNRLQGTFVDTSATQAANIRVYYVGH